MEFTDSGLILILTLSLGFLIGVIITVFFAILINKSHHKKVEKKSQNRNRIINIIGKLCASIESTYSAYRSGTVDYKELQAELEHKLNKINTELNTNIEILDSYYIKYIERFVVDQKCFLKRPDGDRDLGDDTVSVRGVSRGVIHDEPTFQPDQSEPSFEPAVETIAKVETPVPVKLDETEKTLDSGKKKKEKKLKEKKIKESKKDKKDKNARKLEESVSEESVKDTGPAKGEITKSFVKAKEKDAFPKKIDTPILPDPAVKEETITETKFEDTPSPEAKAQENMIEDARKTRIRDDEAVDKKDGGKMDVLSTFDLEATTAISLDSLKEIQKEEKTSEKKPAVEETPLSPAFDVEATQVFDVRDMMQNKGTGTPGEPALEKSPLKSAPDVEDPAPEVPQEAVKEQKLPVAEAPIKAQPDETLSFDLQAKENQDGFFDLDVPGKSHDGANAEKDSIITGDDVMEHMDDFFGFQEEK